MCNGFAGHAWANAAVVLCDRGSVDGAAYWTGSGDLFSAVGIVLLVAGAVQILQAGSR